MHFDQAAASRLQQSPRRDETPDMEKHPRPTPARRPRGFTLIELMIVVVIVSLLAAVAYPSFMSQIRKSRRSDAIAEMSLLQQAQERWRANNPAYTTLSATSQGGYYALASAAGGVAASTYTVTATAQSSQTSDAGCQVLRIQVANGNTNYLAGAADGSLANITADAAAKRCWNR